MSGSLKVDKLRFVDISAEDLNQFICGICLEVLTKPVVTKCCQQSYCEQCISQWLLNHNICPLDRKPLNKSDLNPIPIILKNQLNNLKVKCEYHMKGCKDVIKRDELERHESFCDFNPNRKCKTCGTDMNSDSEHNCIQNLIIKIESICKENIELKRENQELKTRCSDLNESEVIEFTRNNINEYVIRNRSNGLTDQLVEQLVHKCKEAIRLKNSCQDIGRHIFHSSLPSGPWQSWVTLRVSANLTQISENKKNISIEFRKLVIYLYSRPNV